MTTDMTAWTEIEPWMPVPLENLLWRETRVPEELFLDDVKDYVRNLNEREALERVLNAAKIPGKVPPPNRGKKATGEFKDARGFRYCLDEGKRSKCAPAAGAVPVKEPKPVAEKPSTTRGKKATETASVQPAGDAALIAPPAKKPRKPSPQSRAKSLMDSLSVRDRADVLKKMEAAGKGNKIHIDAMEAIVKDHLAGKDKAKTDKVASDKKTADDKAVSDKKAAEDKAESDKKLADEKQARETAEKKLEEEKTARVKAEKDLADKKAIEDKAVKDKADADTVKKTAADKAESDRKSSEKAASDKAAKDVADKKTAEDAEKKAAADKVIKDKFDKDAADKKAAEDKTKSDQAVKDKAASDEKDKSDKEIAAKKQSENQPENQIKSALEHHEKVQDAKEAFMNLAAKIKNDKSKMSPEELSKASKELDSLGKELDKHRANRAEVMGRMSRGTSDRFEREAEKANVVRKDKNSPVKQAMEHHKNLRDAGKALDDLNEKEKPNTLSDDKYKEYLTKANALVAQQDSSRKARDEIVGKMRSSDKAKFQSAKDEHDKQYLAERDAKKSADLDKNAKANAVKEYQEAKPAIEELNKKMAGMKDVDDLVSKIAAGPTGKGESKIKDKQDEMMDLYSKCVKEVDPSKRAKLGDQFRQAQKDVNDAIDNNKEARDHMIKTLSGGKGILGTGKGVSVTLQREAGVKDSIVKDALNAKNFLDKIAGSSNHDLGKIVIKDADNDIDKGRAGIVPGQGSGASKLYLSDAAGAKGIHTAVHELGHALEFSNKNIEDAANTFLKSRVKDDAQQDMSSYAGGEGMKGEKGNKDSFDKYLPEVQAAYVGKTYKGSDGRNSTEILSVGLEHLHKDPVGFCKHDPEYAKFVIAAIKGKFNDKKKDKS